MQSYELQKTSTIFDLLLNKILANKVKFENNKVITEVPLLESIMATRNDKEPELFYEAAKEYLKNRSLEQQFEGIYHLFKHSFKEKTYLLKLVNIKAINPVNLNYNNMLISNQLKKEYVKRGKTRKEYSDFFKGKGSVFAEVKVMSNTEDIGLERAKRKILEALDYINTKLQMSAEIEALEYIVKDEDRNYRHVQLTKYIFQQDALKIDSDNLYTTVNGLNNPLSKRLIDLEKIYFSAKNSVFKEGKLVNFWRYLESFFESKDYKAADVIETLSRILSQNFKHAYVVDHFNLALSIYNSYYYSKESVADYFHINEEEIYDLMNPKTYGDIHLERLIKIINHSYVTPKIKEFIDESDEIKIARIKDFYSALFLEIST